MVLENIDIEINVDIYVGKCTRDEKSCLEMGSYDTP